MASASIATTTTIAPRVEIYTKLVCEVLRPEYTVLVGGRSLEPVSPPSKLCGQDPDVQAAVAKLVTFMAVSMGILSCLTTGWWGQLSDRYGRIPILRLATFGLLISDINFIVVSLWADRLPGGYRLLLVGPAIDGLFGGMSTLMACIYAYVSDSTPPEARSRVFSFTMGIFSGGLAVGPTLGSFLVGYTNDLLSVFYLSTGSHLFYALLIFFVVPESLTLASMQKARKRKIAFRKERDDADAGPTRSRPGVWMLTFFRTILQFITPLAIFLPFRRQVGRGWNWSLTLLALSYAFVTSLVGAYQFKFQYAQKTFGWDSQQMGYWLSIMGVVRASHLMIILPFIIKFFTPKTPPIQLPVALSEPLNPTQSTSPNDVHSLRPSAGHRTPKHSPIFDLTIARVSLFVEFVGYIGTFLAVSSISWTASTMFGAFGGGAPPTMQSVALALYERGPNQGLETGRLFGGLSVIQALSTQVLGPTLFGTTYVATVALFPKAIFVLALAILACSILFMSLVRVPEPLPKSGHEREETTVDVAADI
ncbi:MFS general substrate transporter [Ramaria rubella]|nr:MFS general substrate transporter [Ramaria rubella]